MNNSPVTSYASTPSAVTIRTDAVCSSTAVTTVSLRDAAPIALRVLMRMSVRWRGSLWRRYSASQRRRAANILAGWMRTVIR